jgi:hypothetical protein
VSAQRVCDALNEENFGARIEHDYSQHTDISNSFVVSTISIASLPPSSTVNLTNYLETIPEQKIKRFDIDPISKQLMVVHNPLHISAHELSLEIFEKTGFETKVLADGHEGQLWEFPTAEEGKAVTNEEKSRWMRPTVLLSGIFWLISMLSFIGGNW